MNKLEIIDQALLQRAAEAGPFVPLSPHEKAGWALAEASGEAREYLSKLKELFASP